MSVNLLRKKLNERELDYDGSREIMIQRLEKWDVENNQQESPQALLSSLVLGAKSWTNQVCSPVVDFQRTFVFVGERIVHYGWHLELTATRRQSELDQAGRATESRRQSEKM